MEQAPTTGRVLSLAQSLGELEERAAGSAEILIASFWHVFAEEGAASF